jgi:hypothetical protein
MLKIVDRPDEITREAGRLRQALVEKITPEAILAAFESWATALSARDVDDIPGVAFLRLWLRRSTLEPILIRELGQEALRDEWMQQGRARLKVFPLGIIGHWPAGNIEIQPVLSMTCALLGGNAVIVRTPSELIDVTYRLLEKLENSPAASLLLPRIAVIGFEHNRSDLQETMASVVDGAMIWGGAEAVLSIRALPFPHWARLAVFGPRLSVAMMGAEAWSEPHTNGQWCRRLARDVWQYDQQACSSPQVLFLEQKAGHDTTQFLQVLAKAFREENQLHPRQYIHPNLTASIVLSRAHWLMENSKHIALFPPNPDWTILIGKGTDIPKPTQGKTITVLMVDDLAEPIAKLNGNVQTLGLGMADPRKEASVTMLAGQRGVDRVVKLGQMHVFSSPWDGMDLVRPMVRVVRSISSVEL